MGFAQRWGYKHLSVVNLFAYRTPEPRVLKNADAPIGPANRQALARICTRADLIVAAWGAHGTYLDQSARLANFLNGYALQCFGETVNRQPLHPLYQPSTAELQTYEA